MSGHHISTDKTLLGVAGALLLLTILTVGVNYIHIPAPWNIITAMGIAVVKAGLAFFGLLVGLTLLDTLFRANVMPAF